METPDEVLSFLLVSVSPVTVRFLGLSESGFSPLVSELFGGGDVVSRLLRGAEFVFACLDSSFNDLIVFNSDGGGVGASDVAR